MTYAKIPPKRARGRPRKAPSADGTERYELHLPAALAATMRAEAAAAGLTVAALVRALLIGSVDGAGALQAAHRAGYQAGVSAALRALEELRTGVDGG